MTMRASKAALWVSIGIAAGCTVQSSPPVSGAPTVSVSGRSSATPTTADSALFDAVHPGASPKPVLSKPHMVAAVPALANSPAPRSGQSTTLFGDPEDGRYVYQVGRQRLTMIDAATWTIRWTTAIPVPRSFGASGQSGLTPKFFRGYTEIVAGSPAFYVDGPRPNVFPDQVVTAVDSRGRLLQSCRIHPAVQDPVLLPLAGIVLLPGIPSQGGPEVTAYSAATGARLWHKPGELSVTNADTVYVSTSTPRPGVAAYDAATGLRRWTDLPRGRALTAVAVINGIVYAQRPATTVNHLGAVLALRARDGRRLWQRRWTAADGPYGPQIVSVDAGSVVFLPTPAEPDPEAGTARLISVPSGRVRASVAIDKIGNNDLSRTWQTWPALMGHHRAIVISGGYALAFTLTTSHGYPSSVIADVGGRLAAVASNVAYFISDGSWTSNGTYVAARDLRTGHLLWTVRLPRADESYAASLVAYDHGFAVRLSDGRILRYQ